MTDDGMTWDQMKGFAVDELGRLKWKGKLVKTSHRVSLGGYELFLAALASLSAVASAIFPIGTHFGWW